MLEAGGPLALADPNGQRKGEAWHLIVPCYCRIPGAPAERPHHTDLAGIGLASDNATSV